MARTPPPLGLARATRFGVAAGLLGIDAGPIVDRLHHLVETEYGILAWLAIDARALAAAALLERTTDVTGTLRELSVGLCGRDALSPLGGVDAKELVMLELGVDRAGTYITAYAHGETELDADATLATSLGVTAAAWATLRERLIQVGGAALGERRISVTVRATGEPVVAIARPLRRTDDAQPAADPLARVLRLGATEPQQHLLPRIHAILAQDHPVFARVDGASSRVDLVYGPNTLENALKVATNLGGDELAKRFGTFTGALGADGVHAIELALGPTDPLPARIAVAISSKVSNAT